MSVNINHNNNNTHFISKGVYGCVIKSSIEYGGRLNKKTKDIALKVNVKDEDEHIVGINSLKELSIVIKLNTAFEDTSNLPVVKIIDYYEENRLTETVKKLVKEKFFDGKKKLYIDKIHFIFELCNGGDLHNYLKNKYTTTYVKENELTLIIKDLFKSMYWCHLNNIVHRDMKLENILVKVDSQGNYQSSKLCDFGLSCILKKIKGNKTNTPGVISVYYRSPEVFKKEKYDNKIDLWSLGKMLLNIITKDRDIEFFDSSDTDSNDESGDEFNTENSSNSASSNECSEYLKNKVNKLKQSQVDTIIENYKKSMTKKNTYSEKFLDDYFTIVSGLLQLNPDKRKSLKGLYKYFGFNSEEFNELHLKYTTYINNYKESCMSEMLTPSKEMEIYKICPLAKTMKRNLLKLGWYISEKLIPKQKMFYKEEMVYHFLDMYENVLKYIFDDTSINKEVVSNSKFYKEFYRYFYDYNIGSPSEVYIKAFELMMVYIFYKFFNSLVSSDWISFIEDLPEAYRIKELKTFRNNSTCVQFLEELEYFILKVVCNYQIYNTMTRYEQWVVTKNNDWKKYVENFADGLGNKKKFTKLQRFIIYESRLLIEQLD